jgi:hypothetical protein
MRFGARTQWSLFSMCQCPRAKAARVAGPTLRSLVMRYRTSTVGLNGHHVAGLAGEDGLRGGHDQVRGLPVLAFTPRAVLPSMAITSRPPACTALVQRRALAVAIPTVSSPARGMPRAAFYSGPEPGQGDRKGTRLRTAGIGKDDIGGRVSFVAGDGERENFHRSARALPAAREHTRPVNRRYEQQVTASIQDFAVSLPRPTPAIAKFDLFKAEFSAGDFGQGLQGPFFKAKTAGHSGQLVGFQLHSRQANFQSKFRRDGGGRAWLTGIRINRKFRAALRALPQAAPDFSAHLVPRPGQFLGPAEPVILLYLGKRGHLGMMPEAQSFSPTR